MIVNHRACIRFFFLFIVSVWLGTGAACASELLDAVKANDAGRVQAAISAGADINENDVYMGSPLHIAVARGKVEIAKLLLDAGADIEAAAKGSLNKAHPLHIAARVNGVAIAALLIERGAKVDSRDFHRLATVRAADARSAVGRAAVAQYRRGFRAQARLPAADQVRKTRPQARPRRLGHYLYPPVVMMRSDR